MGHSRSKKREEVSDMMLSSSFHGSRAPLSGTGVLLHQDRHTSSFLFGDRTVTVSSNKGILTPSSIVVDIEDLPKASIARFGGDTFQTESYSIRLQKPIDLSLPKGMSFDVQSCEKAIRPFVQVRDRSISTALLVNQGKADAPSGQEGFIIKRQASVLSETKSLKELANGLLGLGYGAIPSGDHFLVGVILVKNLLGENLSSLRVAVSQYANFVSRTMLLDAMDGHYSAHVGALGAAMILGTYVERHANALLNVGHSSGSDTLAGIWYALSKIEP
jgi:hypothetical protein